MISFELFKKLMSFETKGTICIEILFKVKGSDKFDFCWMGKLYDKEKIQMCFGLALLLMVKMPMIIYPLTIFLLTMFSMVSRSMKFVMKSP